MSRASEEPIRIFIGVDETQRIPAKLFERSVRLCTDAPVIFDRMEEVTWPYPKDKKNFPGTNFSFHRFDIPKRAGYRGRALYVDADMLVLKDIRDLWNTRMNGAAALCASSSDPKKRRQLSVLLLDCAQLDWDVEKIITEGLDAGKYTYDDLLYNLANEPAGRLRESLPPQWNSLDKLEPGKTNLIHYTDLEKQPWLSARHRFGWLWLEHLRDALREGVVTRAEVEEAQAKGWARPSLLRVLDIPRPLWRFYEKTISRRIDKGFVPHQELRGKIEEARKSSATGK
ncbi:MAG: hypothetical protein WCP07_06330 [bacterium]